MQKKIIVIFQNVPLDSEVSAQLFLLCLTSSVLSGILPTVAVVLPTSAVVLSTSAVVLSTNPLQQQVTFD